MEFPLALREALTVELAGFEQAGLLRDAQALSLRYRVREPQSGALLRGRGEAAAYAAARMPATFGAVCAALSMALASTALSPATLLDAGAGTGAASWAADALLGLAGITCLEREEAMIRLGEALMKNGSPSLKNAAWVQGDLRDDAELPWAELVIASYVLNELPEGEREGALRRLWDAASGMLLLVEPGTPEGYAQLMKAREILLALGAHLAAPCPGEKPCAMEQGDWCHFTCRVARSRLHRTLKSGEAPYEDEKFACLAVTREPCRPVLGRILRHPKVHTGHVGLTMCSAKGLEAVTSSKRDGPLYRKLREAKAGDGLWEPWPAGQLERET